MLTNSLLAHSDGLHRYGGDTGFFPQVGYEPPLLPIVRLPVEPTSVLASPIQISARTTSVRRAVIAEGITAEIVEAGGDERLEVSFEADVHTLIVYEEGARRQGDSIVEGIARSSLRDLARKLTLVPAGSTFREWHEPRTPAHIMFVQIDPDRLPSLAGAAATGAPLSARLLFEDAALYEVALKLKRSLEAPENRLYREALGIVLVHELIRAGRDAPGTAPARGGLAGWQQRTVGAYIDAHLEETIPLAALAKLARLSPYHFCRAFKQSFGVPPHRYHTNRRMEHAKALLAERTTSVTQIGIAIGYSETSSFTAAFRKATGITPSAYQRSLG